MSNEAHDVKKEVRTYILVFIALGILTIVTVGLSYLSVGIALAVTLALIVATVKGTLVASFFMHLAHEKKIIYGILLLTVFFFAFMMLLISISPNVGIVGTVDLQKSMDKPATVETEHENAGEHH